jgi:hypothetical protein
MANSQMFGFISLKQQVLFANTASKLVAFFLLSKCVIQRQINIYLVIVI